MKKITCFILPIFIMLAGNAQYNTIDSLKLLLKPGGKDTAGIYKLLQIGIAYQRIKNDSALIYFQEALDLSQEIAFKPGEIESRSRIATFLYSYKADYATALDLYLLNVKEEEQTGDTLFIFHDTRGVGFIYEKIENYKKELESINNLRVLINNGVTKDEKKLTRDNLVLHNRLAYVYEKLNKLDSAKDNIFEVYHHGVKNSDLESIALGSLKLGDIYKKEKKQDSAVYYYQVAIQASLLIKRKDIYGECLTGLGSLYWENKQTDSSFYYSQKALNLSLQEKDADQIIQSATLLARIFFAKKQPDIAYKYLIKAVLLKDSLFSAGKITSIENLSFQESLQKLQEEQTRKKAIDEYKSSLKIYSLIGCLVFLIVIIFFLYRNNVQRNAAKRKIEKAYEDLKSTQSQLIQSEKMASLGELTAGIAHEIQNPLNFVNNFSEVNKELADELEQEIDKGNYADAKSIAKDIKENERKINHHGKRADAIVKGMLQHSRSSTGLKEPTDINALADEYLRLSYHGLRAKDNSFNVTMKTDFDEAIGKINIVPQDIGRVLLNLYNNAFYAVSEKKNSSDAGYEPTVSVSTKKTDNKITISVKDNGSGIPQKLVDKIFQPFFTTKPTGQGTGLGLSLSYDIVKVHGGELKVETAESNGTEFIILIPC